MSVASFVRPDVDVVDESAVNSARHDVLDCLQSLCRSRGHATRRVGDVLLVLPLLTQLVAAGVEFWRLCKARGHVTTHRLLCEMVEMVLGA